jgi:hypothetical protein
MTGIALMIRGPAHNFPGAVEFVIAVLVIILAIFLRMYGPRRRSGPRTEHRTTRRTIRRSTHRPGRSTTHGAGHEPGQNINHGRRSSSKRRAGRP